jgi:hypothetical protein
MDIVKSSGEIEPFDVEKLRRSLQRSGAGEVLVNQVIQELSGQWHENMSTKILFKKAFKLLKRLHRPTAARYNLKQAMLDFGNTGFPFEDFIAEVLRTKGFEVKTRQLLPGECVTHEMDVVAENEEALIWIECKYHPLAGSVSNIKIPLYIHSRFRDLAQYREAHQSKQDHRPAQGWIVTNTRFSDDAMSYGHRPAQGWIVTNTRFSDDAMSYGRCAGMNLISWNYPVNGSLRSMIDQSGLYPVTCLSSLTRREKETLLDKGIVLCQKLMKAGDWADMLHLSTERRRNIMQEAIDLCSQ